MDFMAEAYVFLKRSTVIGGDFFNSWGFKCCLLDLLIDFKYLHDYSFLTEQNAKFTK